MRLNLCITCFSFARTSFPPHFGSSNAVRSSEAIPDKKPSTKPNKAAPTAPFTLSALSISSVCARALLVSISVASDFSIARLKLDEEFIAFSNNTDTSSRCCFSSPGDNTLFSGISFKLFRSSRIGLCSNEKPSFKLLCISIISIVP